MKIFIIDIDGTICENIPNELGAERMRHAKPFNDSIKAINNLYDAGNYICFFTARTDEHAVKYHQLILNKPRKLPPYVEYHFIDDAHVKATTFKGKFSNFVKKNVEVEVFEE